MGGKSMDVNYKYSDYNEIWKPFPDNDRYEFSDHGRVRKSLGGGEYRIMKLQMKRNNPFVRIRVDGGNRFYYIAQLVATAFIPNPNGYKYARSTNGGYRVIDLVWAKTSNITLDMIGVPQHKRPTLSFLRKNIGRVIDDKMIEEFLNYKK